MSVSVQACKVKKDTGSQAWTRPIQASTQYHPVGNAYELPPPPPESKRERQASRQKLVNGKKGQVEEDTSLMTEEQLNERKKAAETRPILRASREVPLEDLWADGKCSRAERDRRRVWGFVQGDGAGAEDPWKRRRALSVN